MTYQQWPQTQTLAFNIPLNTDSGPDTSVLGLPVGNFSMIFRNLTNPASPVDTAGTGAFGSPILNTSGPLNGQVTISYAPSAGDVASTMNGGIIIEAILASGQRVIYDLIQFNISPI